MVFYSNIVNTIGIFFEICGVILLITGAKRLELKLGSHTADHYVDAKTKQTPRVLTLPNDKRTKISIIVAIVGLVLQAFATWMTN
jgi:hypothetical protein